MKLGNRTIGAAAVAWAAGFTLGELGMAPVGLAGNSGAGNGPPGRFVLLEKFGYPS